MSTLKTHNLQSPDASSVNIALAPNAGMVVTGVSTFSNDVNFTTANGNNLLLDNSDNSLKFGDNVKAKFGTGTGDLEIYHTGSGSVINDVGQGHLHLRVGGSNRINIQPDNVQLCYSGNSKLETTNTGTVITGICTATSFSGDGSNLTNLPPSAPVGGSASNKVFFENDKVVSVNYQITSTKNAMTAGPISINSGIGVTVPSGCSWTIV